MPATDKMASLLYSQITFTPVLSIPLSLRLTKPRNTNALVPAGDDAHKFFQAKSDAAILGLKSLTTLYLYSMLSGKTRDRVRQKLAVFVSEVKRQDSKIAIFVYSQIELNSVFFLIMLATLTSRSLEVGSLDGIGKKPFSTFEKKNKCGYTSAIWNMKRRARNTAYLITVKDISFLVNIYAIAVGRYQFDWC